MAPVLVLLVGGVQWYFTNSWNVNAASLNIWGHALALEVAAIMLLLEGKNDILLNCN